MHNAKRFAKHCMRVTAVLIGTTSLVSCAQWMPNAGPQQPPAPSTVTVTKGADADRADGSTGSGSGANDSHAGSAASSTTSAGGDAGSGAKPCKAEQLKPGFRQATAGGMESRASLTLKNADDEPCTLGGYGQLQFQDDQGKPLPTKQVIDYSKEDPSSFVVSPGQVVSKELVWHNDTLPCTYATQIRLTPQEGAGSLTVQRGQYRDPICPNGAVQTGAYQR